MSIFGSSISNFFIAPGMNYGAKVYKSQIKNFEILDSKKAANGNASYFLCPGIQAPE